jgi:hypothetical protein
MRLGVFSLKLLHNVRHNNLSVGLCNAYPERTGISFTFPREQLFHLFDADKNPFAQEKEILSRRRQFVSLGLAVE